MPAQLVSIPTADGLCPAHVLTPDGPGPWPAAILYGDAGGMRPAMVDMGRRLADGGHVVLLPDLYYRFGPYAPLVPREVFAGDARAILGPLMATTDIDRASADTGAFIAYLDTRTDIAGRALGTVGFCMGGGLAIGAAAAHADRFAAVASFHGGHLATDAPTSPHRRVGALKAEVYIGSADNDDSYPPSMAARLEEALTQAGVTWCAERYSGAAHGWMVPDFPVHDPEAADRGWAALLELFGRV
jgi:carboxymethylenebutenolidase